MDAVGYLGREEGVGREGGRAGQGVLVLAFKEQGEGGQDVCLTTVHKPRDIGRGLV